MSDMRYALCLEEMEGRWIAHAPALPGCFASADARDAAQALAPQAIRDYLGWRQAHGDRSVSPDASIETHVDEVSREWALPDNPDYVVNAFFAADVLPLTAPEIPTLRQLFEWSRADLLASLEGLSA